MVGWIDISLPVFEDSVVWPGAPKTKLTRHRSMVLGDRSNNTNLFMNCHTGTHIDAPLHFIREGVSIDQISIDALIGEAHVLDFSQKSAIDVESLERAWPKKDIKRVLLKTSNSKLWQEGETSFVKDYCALTEETARWLLKKKVLLIGVDYLSVQRYEDSPIVHEILLAATIVLLEGLDLSKASDGRYELTCLPLKLIGAEAAPARALLRRI